MLNEEIEQAQRLVKTDAYQMAVSEIVSMYKEGELVINPDFQRLFRWELSQKSRLVESILLGIPLPSIFVFENLDSKWELIDGLQRVSTILEFMGLLKDPDSNDLLPPSALEATKYLKSLHNVVWEKSDRILDLPQDSQVELDKSFQLAIRRSRIGVEILKKPSDNNTKYDLFQRLNAGGTPANSQELRNCIVIMSNKNYFNFMKHLADLENFRTVLNATEDQIERQRHMEYVSRFLVYTFVPYDGTLDVEEYVNTGMISLATVAETEIAGMYFQQTFRLLNEAHGNDALKRFEVGTAGGRVGLVAFETIAIGISKNLQTILARDSPVDFVRQRVIDFWKSPASKGLSGPGVRGTTRIQRTLPFGEEWFSHD